MSTEDARIANARKVLAQIKAEKPTGGAVWTQLGMLASSLEMLLAYVDGESFDDWSARVNDRAGADDPETQEVPR